MIKELHPLVQGCTGITKGTNTIFILPHANICNIPSNRTVTYARIVINHCLQQEDPNRVCITVRGNLIDYLFELTTRTADMVSSKILWNSVISTKHTLPAPTLKTCTLRAPLDQFEYMRISIELLPNNIIKHYQLQEKSPRWLCLHGDPQRHTWTAAGRILANKLLREQWAHHGYFEQPHTPGLWKHVTRPVWFNLYVDNFGIKYIGREHLQHLYDALEKETYEIVEDWTGNLNCGIIWKWN
jgi:hypothetical protein